jgi:hypothetical protein
MVACASGPATVRAGHLVRIQRVEADTLIGTVLEAQSDTLFLRSSSGDSLQVPRASISVIEVDRASFRPWLRPLACATAGVGILALGLSLDDLEWRMILPAISFAHLSWICLDDGPNWRSGKIAARNP